MAEPGQMGREAEGGSSVQSLVFRAGTMMCALHLSDVVETMRPLAVRPLAGTPPYVRGISIMRGVPTPVVDVARLIGGEQADVLRFVAVRTEHGPVAFATGEVLGIRATEPDAVGRHQSLLGPASSTLIAGVATIDGRPLLLLQSMRVVPDEVWAAAAEAAVPS